MFGLEADTRRTVHTPVEVRARQIYREGSAARVSPLESRSTAEQAICVSAVRRNEGGYGSYVASILATVASLQVHGPRAYAVLCGSTVRFCFFSCQVF